MRDERLTQAWNITWKVWVAIALFSFIYGGIYTEMIVEGLPFDGVNLVLAFLGGFLVSVPLVLLCFLLCFAYFHVRGKKK